MSAILRDQVEDIHALSPVQQGILFHSMVEPELAPYVEQAIWRLRGDVVPELFERAWNELVARHTILRSVFRQARRQPVQIVLKQRSIDVPFHDLTSLPPDAQRRALDDLARAALAPFSLADGPLFRLALVRLASDEWRLLWTFHHIILDGLTFGLLLNSMCAIYDALASGEPLPAAEPVPFSRFVTWLAQQNQDDALAFWAKQLEGFAAPTPLPYDRPPANVTTRTHRARHIRLSRETSGALADLARRRRVTVSRLMQAAWALLLARYSGDTEVAFGLTLSGRPADLAHVERIAGPFINTLPVRVSLEGDPRLADLLQSLQQQFFDIEQHGHVGLADIQRHSAIQPPDALFESAINVYPPMDRSGFPSKSFVLGGIAQDGPHVARTNYDLMVDVALLESIGITITYVDEIFDAATIDAILANLGTLAEAIALCDPDVRVSALNVVSPAERTRLLNEFNAAGEAGAFDGGAVARIEAQAERAPQATAAVAGSTRLSYETLNARANRIAWWLREAGIGREDRVAIFGERCTGLLASVLGILKAGAAFVPMDPMQPDARLASIVAASGVRVILCGPESAARALTLAGAALSAPPVVCWDAAPADVAIDDAGVWASAPAANPPHVTGPKDSACVFFTSGSTGVPKGVVVEHAGMLNHHAAKISFLRIDASSVVAQNASIGFDISVWQMLAALEAGGAVAIYNDDTAFDQARLAAGIARDGVTILETVPTLLESLIEAASRIDISCLKILVSNAEFLPVPLCRRWLERFPHIPLVNTFGPTECSDDTAHHWQPEAPAEDMLRVPIGRPIPGARMYIVDRALQPVPIGASGEIAIGGVAVGRGYLADPVRTALAFVPDPFSTAQPGARLYLTGDTGRWTRDGLLEFVRRDGDQVKVRGHRIELGEIQAALVRYAGVRHAVATVRNNAKGEPQIVAYWVGEDDVDPATLRDTLAATLPRYMLPSAIVRLEAFPVTPNGKLDRRAVPAPPDDQPQTDYTAPADGVESAVAEIWAEVLGVERVGATDNFFELGGQSLKTLQIRSRLTQRFGVDVPLRAIFRNRTVREQARAVAEALDGRVTPAAAIPRLPDAEAYALSHAQRRLWFMHQLDPADTTYNLLAPVVVEGTLDPAAFERAWSEVVARQPSLRTTFSAIGGEPVQRIASPVAVRLPHVDLSAMSDSERGPQIERLLAETRLTPFTLDTPPVRALLLTLTPERHLFALVIHHLVSDAWSGDVLLRDLLELYRAARDGEPPRLSPMPIRYVDYAAWQNERIAAGAFADDERYWMTRLSGELPTLDLPPSSSATSASTPDVHAVTFTIDAETAERVRQAISDRDVTPFMLRLALVKAWLACLTGADDLLVGSAVAGRDRPETESLVGFFVNLLPLRTSLAGDPSFAQVVDRVKQSCLEAYAHQDYPFDAIVQRLNPARETGRMPILDVLFTTFRSGRALTVEGLKVAGAEGTRDREFATLPGARLGTTLLVHCREEADGTLSWPLTFDARWIDRDTAVRAAEQFEALIRAIVRVPRAPLSALRTLASAEGETVRLRRQRDREEYPLSLAQRDVWNESRLHAGSRLGTLAVRVTLDGPLDQEAFVQTLKTVANRHDAFRLAFGERDGAPFQRLAAAVDVPVLVEDLSRDASETPARRVGACSALGPTKVGPYERGFETTVAERKCIQAAEDELVRIGFDLSVAPLARGVLLRLSAERHVLLLAWHALIVDAWHINEFLESVGETYARRLRGERNEPASPSIGPTDIALWQDARLQSGRLVPEANYWRRPLRMSADAALPADRSPAANRTFDAATLVHDLSPETVRTLRALASRQGTTLLRVVVSAFAALVAQLTRERDLALVMPMAARPRGAGGTIGSFVHPVPIGVRVDNGVSFDTLLADVTRRMATAHDRREFAAALDRTEAHEPRRVPATIAVSRGRRVDRGYGGLRMRTALPVCAAIPYDLLLTIVEDAGVVALHITYATERFDASTVTRLSEYLAAGLASAADPQQRIDVLDFLSTKDRKRLVHAVNATWTDYPAVATVHALVEEHAAHRPDAPAVLAGEERWTYRALNEYANRLARHLITRGVESGDLVATFLARSPELVVAQLAILKAGAAYLPLNPDDPADRVRFMLADADVRVAITMEALGGRLDAAVDLALVTLDRDAARIAGCPADNLPTRGDGSSLAHVMYTSGSTGRPKGAMLPHRGITRLVRDTNYVTLQPDDRVAQIANCSFDAATFEIWGALLNGACLVVLPPETVLSPRALAAAFDAHDVTVSLVTPALFNQIAREVPACLSRLRCLLTGGDVMNPSAARQVLESDGPAQLINLYGPTENSCVTTYYPVTLRATESATIPIGRPIGNTEVYIVNSAFHPVGVGIPGELCTGGAGLANGYWRRPTLTAETFVPDPFGRVPGARLYRTGDLARWRADGSIEFLGRVDHQVKIRGHRVELGEIEAVLRQHPDVADTVVVVSEARTDVKQLVAYVVPVPGASIAADALRRHLSAHLPGYMVPTWIVTLASLPLTSTGKVDRKALPAPDERSALGVAYVAPRSALEEDITAVWRRILRVEQVGIHDSFFDLGGDSIQCIVAVSHLAERGIRSTPKAFYDHPTVAALAAVVEQTGPTAAADEGPVSGPVPLVPIQRFFFDQEFPAAHHFNAVALARADRLDAGAVERALQAILDHHDALRMRFSAGPDGWRQHNPGPGEAVSFEIIDLGDDRLRLTAECERLQATSLDLTRGPLFRGALFRLADGTDRLLILTHHLVTDVVSGRILLEDLTRAYEQALRGEAVELASRRTSFKRWAEILEAHAPERIDELPYWRSIVEPGWPSLPLDHDLGPSSVGSSEQVRIEIDADVTRVLLTRARRTLGMQMHEVLLAALGRALGEWTGAPELGVMVDSHGREDIANGVDLSRTVGWFTAMYPIRLETGRAVDLSAHLRRTREMLDAIPGRGLGYGLLRYTLRRPELATGPTPEVSFNYQGQFTAHAARSRFETAHESTGAFIDPRSRRLALLAFWCAVVDGRLRVVFGYSGNKHRAETVDAVARRFARELREIATLCADASPAAHVFAERDSTPEPAAAGA